MRYRSIAKWDKPEESENLLFFAQLLEELLFNFSLDTYKPSALNSSLLCSEALDVIEEIENGNIKKPNLNHVLKELCESLRRDNVAKSLLTLELSQINSVLLEPSKSTLDKKVVVELIHRQIHLNKYKKQNEELLTKVIIGEKNFSQIRSLTRNFATTLLNLGYGSNWLSKITLDFFYYDKNRIADNSAIKDFLQLFDREPFEYMVIFKGCRLFEKISNSCERFEVKILESLAEINVDTSAHDFSVGPHELLIQVNKINARDIHSAKAKADSRLELINTLFSLFHHKKAPDFQHDCLVINVTNGEVNRSKKAINIMHKCVDLKPPAAARKMNLFISDFSLEKISFQKFTRSAELHSLALNSDSIENQMINLWIALESIIPKNKDDNLCTIEGIVENTLPFLNVTYYQRLISRLAKDLINWKRNFFISLIKPIEADGITQKLIKLISLPEYEEQRNQLRAEFKDFHLISDRFEYFCSVFSSPKTLLEGLDNHSKRVEWQIRRIYRARNIIVHSGKTPSYTSILVENIHDYLDVIIGTLIQLATKPKRIISIDQGFKYLSLTHESYKRELGRKGSVFTSELIDKFFSGKV
ncbi:hypothetical protein [Pseudoalteromonas lipolytica]|uniref:Apea-like HEPN domain-containing protein n=1 Tax=Pseudoalteromonas lipolytica TaxID=570156 RepID=A0ABU8SU00_9GAMM